MSNKALALMAAVIAVFAIGCGSEFQDPDPLGTAVATVGRCDWQKWEGTRRHIHRTQFPNDVPGYRTETEFGHAEVAGPMPNELQFPMYLGVPVLESRLMPSGLQFRGYVVTDYEKDSSLLIVSRPTHEDDPVPVVQTIEAGLNCRDIFRTVTNP